MKAATLGIVSGENIIGKRYNSLVIICESVRYITPANGKTMRQFLCRCDCGAETIVIHRSLVTGNTKSCGKCLVVSWRHGLNRHPIQISWSSIKTRCYNKNVPHYKHYGGRGIALCERWNTFLNFYEDMVSTFSQGKSVDRIDTDKNYSCGKCDECLKNGWKMNCRWATSQEQNNNRRNNRRVEYKGVSKSAADWAREYKIPHYILCDRMDAGWPFEKAVLTKIRQQTTLTKRKILSIANSSLTTSKLAKKIGVSVHVINSIRGGYTWSTVTGIKKKVYNRRSAKDIKIIAK
jgi:predicted transposase YbfD/YdcC